MEPLHAKRFTLLQRNATAVNNTSSNNIGSGRRGAFVYSCWAESDELWNEEIDVLSEIKDIGRTVPTLDFGLFDFQLVLDRRKVRIGAGARVFPGEWSSVMKSGNTTDSFFRPVIYPKIRGRGIVRDIMIREGFRRGTETRRGR